MKEQFEFKIVKIRKNPNAPKLKGTWKCEILPMDNDVLKEELLKFYSKEEIKDLIK